jgi:AraC-type DNA-binding domain-containing proteins
LPKRRFSVPTIQFAPISLDDAFPISAFQYTQKSQDLKRLHFHHSFEIGLCLEGRGVFFIENRPLSFRVNDISFIYPNQPHIAQSPNEIPSRWIFIDVDIDLLLAGNSALLNRIWEARASLPSIIHHQDARSLLGVLMLMIHELEHPGDQCQDIVKHLFSAALFLILDMNSEHTAYVPTAKPNAFTIISPALAFMAQNYDQEITISDLAQKCNLSETHFRVVFKSAIGKTPQRYLSAVRLKMAKALLRSTDMSILQTANSVGYGNVSAFNRMFKEDTGRSPMQYRKDGK